MGGGGGRLLKKVAAVKYIIQIINFIVFRINNIKTTYLYDDVDQDDLAM